jgi:tryptophan synthase beta chain
MYRPTPFIRAVHLEKHLDTPAKIFFKYEGVSPAGSHKPNTAIAQAFYNKAQGVKRLTTETGAGQWGSALSFATNLFGLECMVYMVRASFDQKPYRKSMIRTWGGNIVASPSDTTSAGQAILAKTPDSPGSLGIAISEAVEDCVKREDTKYSLGSVLNHVMMHQTVIGQEVFKQVELAGISPDIMIACAGGGSNFAGFTFPFIREKIRGNLSTRIIAVEPSAAPSLTKGSYVYDFGDTACTTPLIKMYTLGHSFIPAPIHSGGLRYHGMSPLVCHLYDLGFLEAVALNQRKIFDAAVIFARTEGIIPAPEPSHVIAQVIDEALACKKSGESKVIVFHLCGHGHFDMAAYEDHISGKLVDYELPIVEVENALAELPNIE